MKAVGAPTGTAAGRLQPRWDWALSTLLLGAGQALLIALGSVSRVNDPGAGSSGPLGIALLAPDSIGYLDASATWPSVGASAWPRRGYLILLRLGHLLGDAATVIVLVQVAASIAAGVLLLRAGRRLAGPVAGLVAAAVLLVNPMTAQWVRFVLTESLFYAAAVSVAVLGSGARVRTLGSWLPEGPGPLLVAAVVAATLRPSGPLLAGAALTLAARSSIRSRRGRGVAAIAIWIAVGIALAAGSAATGPPAEGTFESQLRSGVVVEGSANVRTTIPMPDAPGTGIRAFVIAEPVATARLAVLRVLVEVAQVRRHYPTPVNVALGIAIVAILLLAAAGLADRRGRSLRTPTLVVAAPLVGIVAVTFAVPEGRYGWAGLVALAPAVGVGAAVLRDRVGAGQSTGGTAK